MAPLTVAELLSKHSFLSLTPSNRIKCEVTGHELPLQVDAIVAHISSGKFKKQLEWYSHDFGAYLPHIVPHKSNPKKLYCKLTQQELNKIPAEVEKHANGKRFNRLKEEYEQKQSKKGKKVAAAQGNNGDDEQEDADFWMPPEESESEDDEEEVDDMSDLVGDDSDDEPDAAEAQGRSKPKADSKPAKRKVVTVDDDDFAVIKRTRKESAKGSKGQGIQKAAGSAKAQKRSTSKHSRNARE